MDNNFFNEDFSPTEISVCLPGTGPRNQELVTIAARNVSTTKRNHHKLPDKNIYDIQADEENVCVSSDNGYVFFYESNTLKLLWSVKICEGRLQICLSNRRVFVATSKCKQGHLYVLSRHKGSDDDDRSGTRNAGFFCTVG